MRWRPFVVRCLFLGTPLFLIAVCTLHREAAFSSSGVRYYGPAALLLASSRYQRYHHSRTIQDITFRKEVMLIAREIEADDRKEKWYANTSYEFNKFKSDSIGTFRDLPDTRHPLCKSEFYFLDESAKVSVIISFFNEAHSTLMRTVISVLLNTPKDMLEEIILVDDASESGSDGKLLLKLPKVRLFSNNERQGLIRSRVLGADKSTGKFLMFLDSHCEVNRDWLEPLLHHIYQNPRSIACPVIDSIDAETFQYNRTSDQLKAGFDWSFRFKWIEFKRDSNRIIQPYQSAIAAGGLFLIEKEWFGMLGRFDTGLEIWGIESLEISLKTWLCGGSLAIIPCSRVGHVFQKKHSYSFPMGNAYTYLRNSKRVAEVWLGDYKRFFYQESPTAMQIEVGSLDEQLEVKGFLNCKPFDWYLENVFPELRVPNNSDSSAYGQIKQGDTCLYAGYTKLDVQIKECRGTDSSLPPWSLTPSAEIRTKNLCLTANDTKLLVTECNGDGSQKWIRNGRTLKTWRSGLCLDTSLGEAILSECRQHAPTQSWDFSVELQSHHTSQKLF